jgi:hypothetical protein
LVLPYDNGLAALACRDAFGAFRGVDASLGGVRAAALARPASFRRPRIERRLTTLAM